MPCRKPKGEKPISQQRYTPPCFRSGIETYDLGPGSETWIAAAVPGCGADDMNNLFKHAIVASACGTENMVQGQHELDRTAQGPTGILCQGDIFATYRAFNISYAETGVFGIVAKTKASTACKSACMACNFLANVSRLDSQQIEDGKKRLQLNLALHDEDPVRASQGLAMQALSCTRAGTVENAMFAVDAISNADVAATANALSSNGNRMAIAIVGDVDAVPTDIFHNIM